MRGLTEGEQQMLGHWSMYGSDMYPIAKAGRVWIWHEAFGVKGSPTVYKTKKAAYKAFEAFIDVLLDAKAGRI